MLHNKLIVKLSSLGFFILVSHLYAAQLQTNTTALQSMAAELKKTAQIEKLEAVTFAQMNNMPIREELKDGKIIEIQKIENGMPLYYTTYNGNAAISTHTDKLWSIPFNTTGLGYSQLGEWDGGAVRATHQELNGRVVQVDGATEISDHATHVAGTLIASGVNSSAKGMAHKATLKAYGWNSDDSEMATAAASGLEVSNHSYGYITGWHYYGNYWFGDTSISQSEAYQFGYYSSASQSWDNIAYNAPNYLIIKAAGNDRNDNAPSAGTAHYHGFGSTVYTDIHYSDGYDQGGYDTIGAHGVSKNILTIGAVDDVPTYNSPSDVVMSSFSGWGPADDGRIKPDIVANGVGLYSSVGSSDSAYASYNGTSMASPNTTGTLALLQQYYQQTHSNEIMRSATLKALVLHSAEEAGNTLGPDYQFGWGLLNAEKAANLIKKDTTNNVIDELVLNNGNTYSRTITLSSTDLASLKVTLVWTDPAGTPVAPALDPADKMLINDLDLKIVKDGVTYYPWKLDKDNPSNAATQNSTNDVDNVEQVYIDVPEEGTYTVIVDHKGSLNSGNQPFSIILSTSGVEECTENQHHKQGTLICIDNTTPIVEPPFLSDYAGYIQGTSDSNPEAVASDLTLSLPEPSCPEERPEQGTDTCF